MSRKEEEPLRILRRGKPKSACFFLFYLRKTKKISGLFLFNLRKNKKIRRTADLEKHSIKIVMSRKEGKTCLRKAGAKV